MGYQVTERVLQATFCCDAVNESLNNTGQVVLDWLKLSLSGSVARFGKHWSRKVSMSYAFISIYGAKFTFRF